MSFIILLLTAADLAHVETQGPTEQAVKAGKAEVKRILEETTERSCAATRGLQALRADTPSCELADGVSVSSSVSVSGSVSSSCLRN